MTDTRVRPTAFCEHLKLQELLFSYRRGSTATFSSLTVAPSEVWMSCDTARHKPMLLRSGGARPQRGFLWWFPNLPVLCTSDVSVVLASPCSRLHFKATVWYGDRQHKTRELLTRTSSTRCCIELVLFLNKIGTFGVNAPKYV